MQSSRNHEAEQQPTTSASITVSQLNDSWGGVIREKGSCDWNEKADIMKVSKQLFKVLAARVWRVVVSRVRL